MMRQELPLDMTRDSVAICFYAVLEFELHVRDLPYRY